MMKLLLGLGCRVNGTSDGEENGPRNGRRVTYIYREREACFYNFRHVKREWVLGKIFGDHKGTTTKGLGLWASISPRP